MKSRKKVVASLAIIILAVAATVIANSRVTRFLDENYGIEQQFFSIGESVPFGNNYQGTDAVSVDGYSLRVDDAEVLTYEELLSRFDQTTESMSELQLGNMTSSAEKVCLITATLANEYSSAQGIDLSQLYLSGVNYDMSFDTTLTIVANTFLLKAYQDSLDTSAYLGMLGVHLDQGTSTTIYLVYDFYKGYFSAKGWDHLESEALTLDITYYPVKKTIELSLN